MITQQERERIFALYWGQPVSKHHELTGLSQINSIDTIREAEFRYLYLTPLHLITDEHAVEVAMMMDWEKPETKEDMRGIRDELIVKVKYNWVTWVCVDFLRSNGYALPCYGHTVNSLVEQGVFKLREPNKQ